MRLYLGRRLLELSIILFLNRLNLGIILLIIGPLVIWLLAVLVKILLIVLLVGELLIWCLFGILLIICLVLCLVSVLLA